MKSIENQVNSFIISCPFVSANTKDSINIIDPMKYEEFILAVTSYPIPLPIKMILLLQLSSGARISEILALQKKDVKRMGGSYVIKISVLKKKKYTLRYIPLHDALSDILKPYLKSLTSERLFSYSRQYIFQLYKSILNLTTHSIRHSFISYCISVRKMSPLEIAALLEVSPSMVIRYFKYNPDNITMFWKNISN